MFFKNRKLELEIAKQKAKEAEALAEAKKAEAEKAKATSRAEYNKLAFLKMMEEMSRPEEESREIQEPFIPENVIPKGKTPAVAMDSDCSTHVYQIAKQNTQFFPLFEGFPKLSFLVQSSDYFSVVETTANEMTREWGEFKVIGGDSSQEGQKERVKALNDAFNRFGIKKIFNQHIRNELTFGRSQLFIKIEGQEDRLDLPLVISDRTIPKGSLKSISVIEPIWSTPSEYNSTDPTEPDFFKPTAWWVSGKEIHADRLLTLVSRPVPDMYKPAYNFSGLSMLQLMQPYVERWQRAVDSTADLLDDFSTSGIKTDLGDILSGSESNPSTILSRVMMFNMMKSNRGAMVLDKDLEEFFQVNTPLTGVPDLMRHFQEQLAAPSHTPLVKLLGLTPSGLNANSEGEIRVYYDYTSSQQEFTIQWHIERISKIMQLHLFGNIDESIRFVFNPLYQLSDKEISEMMMYDCQSLESLLRSNVISQEEARRAIASQEDWILSSIDPEEAPEPMGDFDFGEEDENPLLAGLQTQQGNRGMVSQAAASNS